MSFLALPGGVDPRAVTTGPDGNLWVTDPDDGQIFRVTTSDVAKASRHRTSGKSDSPNSGTRSRILK